MPLVDYTSDSDNSASETDHPDTSAPPKKKPRTASPPGPSRPQPGANPGPTTSESTLPPLPPSFHDLYASTVRTTTRDDPSLHQGRTRQIPHVPGNWPSHVYIEWHPPAEAHALLTELVSSLQAQAGAGAGEEEQKITSFLQSDLGAPLPLHISLSRPIVLSSEDKDNFLCEVESAVRGSGLAEFGLEGSRVEWHRTAESVRSFLVLRVHTRRHTINPTTKGDVDGGSGWETNPNPELTELLRRSNAAVARFGQPGLYEWAENEEGDENGRRVGEAFHVSIAWSFSELTEELVRATEQVFGNREAKKRIQELRVPVEGVKVKIGNVVTHVALRQTGSRATGKVAKNLLGL